MRKHGDDAWHATLPCLHSSNAKAAPTPPRNARCLPTPVCLYTSCHSSHATLDTRRVHATTCPARIMNPACQTSECAQASECCERMREFGAPTAGRTHGALSQKCVAGAQTHAATGPVPSANTRVCHTANIGRCGFDALWVGKTASQGTHAHTSTLAVTWREGMHATTHARAVRQQRDKSAAASRHCAGLTRAPERILRC